MTVIESTCFLFCKLLYLILCGLDFWLVEGSLRKTNKPNRCYSNTTTKIQAKAENKQCLLRFFHPQFHFYKTQYVIKQGDLIQFASINAKKKKQKNQHCQQQQIRKQIVNTGVVGVVGIVFEMYLYIVVSNIVVKYSRNNNIMTKQNSKKP
jgi:hypothetical protein